MMHCIDRCLMLRRVATLPNNTKHRVVSPRQLSLLLITAARTAYAGTEGCYEMLVFFYFFYLMRNL